MIFFGFFTQNSFKNLKSQGSLYILNKNMIFFQKIHQVIQNYYFLKIICAYIQTDLISSSIEHIKIVVFVHIQCKNTSVDDIAR